MERKDWGYYTSLLGLAILVLWLVLKLSGIIHSPLYQEMIPFISGAVILGGLVADMRNLKADVREIKNATKEIQEKVYHLDKEVEIIKSKIQPI